MWRGIKYRIAKGTRVSRVWYDFVPTGKHYFFSAHFVLGFKGMLESVPVVP